MELTKLKSLGLAVAVGLGVSGCYRPEYRYDGNIDDDKVSSSYNWDNSLGLEVTKPNGNIIAYDGHLLYNGNIILKEVSITENGKNYKYNDRDTIGREVMKKAYPKFTNYFGRILETNRVLALSRIE